MHTGIRNPILIKSLNRVALHQKLVLMYNVWHPLSGDVLVSLGSSSYKLCRTEAAVLAQRPVEHAKNIMTGGMPHSVDKRKNTDEIELTRRMNVT